MITDYIEYAVELAKIRKEKEQAIIDKNQKIRQPIIDGIKKWEGINGIQIENGINDRKLEYYEIKVNNSTGIMILFECVKQTNFTVRAYSWGFGGSNFDLTKSTSPHEILKAIAEFISLAM